MDGNLPTELTENILLRLPIKSLLRFTTVSNSWASTITSHQFHVAHHKYIKSSTHNIFWIPSIYKNHKRGHLIQIKGQEVQRLSMAYPESSFRCRNLCCCNGLILSTSTRGRPGEKMMYEVWNPSTGSCIKFQCPYENSFDDEDAFRGLCYDPSAASCKVVISDMIKYAVFDCMNNHWTEMKEVNIIMEDPDDFSPYKGGASSLNGDFFWIASSSLPEDFAFGDIEIVCFDSREEKFKTLPKPIQHDYGEVNEMSFISMGNHICLHMIFRGASRQETFQLKIDGGQYSWKKLHLYWPKIDDLRWIRPVYLKNENEILLTVKPTQEYTDHLQLYNSTQQTSTGMKTDPKIVVLRPIVPFHSTLFGFT